MPKLTPQQEIKKDSINFLIIFTIIFSAIILLTVIFGSDKSEAHDYDQPAWSGVQCDNRCNDQYERCINLGKPHCGTIFEQCLANCP